ncbi:hypothetical protein AC1031_014954 [Aphanomyces cochlioides]|nr:hypothetical protein AC1031_014954 [Aphanomyces cochlioides]
MRDALPSKNTPAMTDIFMEDERWECSVCAYHNLDDYLACCLCETSRDVQLVDVLTAIDHITSFFSDSTPLITHSDLTRAQRSARLRKQWVRELNDNDCCLDSTNAFSLQPNSLRDPLDRSRHPSPSYRSQSNVDGSPIHLSDLVATDPQGAATMTAKRKVVFEEALELLSHLLPSKTVGLLDEFEYEYNENRGSNLPHHWYTLIAEGLQHHGLSLFRPCDVESDIVCINPDSDLELARAKINHLDAFHVAGRFVGQAILDCREIPLHLSPVLFKCLLGIPMTFEDVEAIDPAQFQRLVTLLEETDPRDLKYATFCIMERHTDDKIVEVNLKPNGRHIVVNQDNKHEYVDLMMRHLLFGRIESQLLAFIQGVYDIVPPELLLVFDHKEIEMLLTGHAALDLLDWRCKTIALLLTHFKLADVPKPLPAKVEVSDDEESADLTEKRAASRRIIFSYDEDAPIFDSWFLRPSYYYERTKAVYSYTKGIPIVNVVTQLGEVATHFVLKQVHPETPNLSDVDAALVPMLKAMDSQMTRHVESIIHTLLESQDYLVAHKNKALNLFGGKFRWTDLMA